MKPHPVDPVAIVTGLLFTLSGLVLLADQWWEDADTAALSAIAVTVVGLALAAVVIARFVADDDPEHPSPTGPPVGPPTDLE